MPRFSDAWLERHRVATPSLDRTQIVGIGHALAEVDSLLARLREPERAARLGATPPRGILFHGQPGTGKTLLARYLAASLGPETPLFEVGSDELSPERLRGTIRYLSTAFRRSVLFIDEADAWAIDRRFDEHSPETRLLLTAALSALDGLVATDGPVVVVATNRSPHQLDDALVRSGRLGIHVAFDLPTEPEREGLLELYLASRPTDGTLDLRRAARLTREKTPADLRAYIEDAAGIAMAAGLDRITTDHVVEAIRRGGAVVSDEERPERRWRTAVHEAGHVCVGVALRGASWIHAVRIGPDDGSTTWGDEGIEFEERPDDEQRAAVTASFGGSAAERAVLGEPTLSSAADVSSATHLTLARLQAGFEPDRPPVALDEFHRNVPDVVKTMVGGTAVEILRVADLTARRIVEGDIDAVRRFAAALDAAGELTGPELAGAIDAAGFVWDGDARP